MSNDQVLEIKNHVTVLVEGLRDEIRIVANGVIANTQAINHLDVRMDKLENKMATLENKVDTLEGKMDRLEGKVDRLEDKVDTLDCKMENLEKSNNKRISHLEKEVFTT